MADTLKSAWKGPGSLPDPFPIPLSGRSGFSSKDKRLTTVLEGSMDHVGPTQKVERLVEGEAVLFGADPQSLYAVPLGNASVCREALAALNHSQRHVLQCLWTALDCLVLDTGGSTARKPMRVRLF